MEQRRAPESSASLIPKGCTWPVVLGVDPGTLVCGHGAVVVAPDGPRLLAAGTIRARAKASVPERLAAIRRALERELELCRPTVVVVERAFTAVNIQSAFRIGEARGVILACAAAAGAEVVQLSPAEAKKSVVGNGAASKQQIAHMVARQLGIEVPETFDVSDALALALAHVKRMEWGALVSRARDGGAR